MVGEYEQTLTDLGIDLTTIIRDRSGKIPSSLPEESLGPDRLAILPPLLQELPTPPQIELREQEIGAGGMGRITVGVQVSLDREVAVKVLHRDSGQTPRAARALLREAQVLGALEHPNIVPVHLLGRDETDRPLMVMKRVVGTAWSSFISEEEGIRAPAGEGDPLEWHLSILIAVCNAIHYAHSKGVIHRDVKPSNVMIGEFGEVYLMDWGLAVAVGEEPRFGLPPAAGIRAIEGTPAVMAPEMAAADGTKIGPWTDVYQLGACLHMILTGAPRHRGGSLINIMASAFFSEDVDYGPAVPAELGEIANRAMARDPEDRYASAEALRQALTESVRHATSARLTREAVSSLERLGEQIGLVGDEEASRRVYALFAECRFAFREALRGWPENPEALAGQRAAVELMASHELDQGNYHAAAALIAELPGASPDLARRLDALRLRQASDERKIARWRKLERDVDARIGSSERSLMMFCVGLIFASIYFALGLLSRNGVIGSDFAVMGAIIVVYAGVIGTFHVVMRSTLHKNRWNRQFATMMWISVIAGLAYWPLAYAMGLRFNQAIASLLIVYLAIGMTMGVALGGVVIPSVLPLLLCAVLAALNPDGAYEAMGLASFFTFTLAAIGWKLLTARAAAQGRPVIPTEPERPASRD